MSVRVVFFREVSVRRLSVGAVVIRKVSAVRLPARVVFSKVSAGTLYVGVVFFGRCL